MAFVPAAAGLADMAALRWHSEASIGAPRKKHFPLDSPAPPPSCYALTKDMKTGLLRTWFWLCFCLLLGAPLARVRAADASLTNAPALYDESADGSKQIAEALDTAQKENKHVLLEFGANWAIWCSKLHNVCQTNQAIATILKSDYVVVRLDVNKGHNRDLDTRFGHPTHFGLPVLVVLDADGRQLCTQDAAKLEEGNHYNLVKVLTFLTAYAVKENG
jgi:hypothetical protein